MENVVSLHPYFTVQDGKLEDFKALFPRFIELTKTEEKCYYYDFSICGDVVHCREAYNGAAGVLTHIENVGEVLGEAAKISEITRFEVHGPEAELEKLKEPLAGLNPQWFVFQSGI
ncbi:MAG: hypothetical protein ACI8UO_005871 [Verrucomicrobiales bacterium]|jgi:hypothetical protein